MTISLNRIMVFVSNVQACAAFYCDKFGFKPLGEWSDEWAEVDANGCRLAFHQAYGENGKVVHPTGSSSHPYKIVFKVPDVDQARQSLISKGVQMDEVWRCAELGNLVLCDGTDLEGHRFQICNR